VEAGSIAYLLPSAADRGEKWMSRNGSQFSFSRRKSMTYMALALFLSKEGIKERLPVGNKEIFISPS
jgi:hypothetical protein